MTGQHRGSVDSQLTQQNIGKFVNFNKTTKERKADKGGRITGTEPVDQIKPSVTKQLGQNPTALKKHNRPASRSPEEVQKPPPKGQYTTQSNTMSAPSQSSNIDTKESDKVTDFAALEK